MQLARGVLDRRLHAMPTIEDHRSVAIARRRAMPVLRFIRARSSADHAALDGTCACSVLVTRAWIGNLSGHISVDVDPGFSKVDTNWMRHP